MKRYRQTLAVLALGAAAAVALLLLLRTPPERPVALEGVTPEEAAAPPAGPGSLLRTDGTPANAGGPQQGGASRGAPEPVDLALSGRVLDDRERPIRDAAIRVARVDPAGLRGAPYRDGPVLAETRSDADGRFVLPAPAAAWLRVTASAAGYATVGRLVASTGADLVLHLAAAGTLILAVRDESDRPIDEADVAVRANETSVDARSGPDGEATLDALAPGDVHVSVSRDGYGAVRAGPYTIRAGEALRVPVVLPAVVRLAGVIRADADGAPVADAKVFVARPGRAAEAEPTGSDGRFGPVDAGGAGERVFVSVHARGFAPALEPVVLHGPEEQSVEVRLTAAEDWTGQVVLPDGGPAPGAQVAYTSDGVAGHLPASTLADEAGRFALPPPPLPAPGRRVVLAARRGTLEAALALRPGMLRPDPLRLVLAGGSRVTGRVVDGAGRPVAGVQVRLAPAWSQVEDRSTPGPATSRLLLANEAGFVGLAAATGADGAWGIEPVPPGPYTVRFRQAGDETVRPDVLEVGAGPASAGTWTLGAGVTLRGRVLDARGRAAPGATVRLAGSDAAGPSRSTTTDAEGRYAFKSADPGLYRLSAQLGLGRPTAVQVQLDADREGVDLDLEEHAVVTGRVVLGDDNRPYSGLLTITLRRATGAPRAAHSVRVRDGAFGWEGAPVGSWILEGRAPGGLVGRSAGPLEIEAGRVSSATVALAARTVLEGSVRTATGDPVPSARVSLTGEADGRRRFATADGAGTFRFEGLEPGGYALKAWGRGGAPTQERIGAEGGGTRRVELKLAVAGRARVRVIDPDGLPVAGAVVLFRTEDGAVPTARPDRTGRDGVVLREDLPVGAVEIRVRATDGSRGYDNVVIDAGRTSDVRVRLQPADR